MTRIWASYITGGDVTSQYKGDSGCKGYDKDEIKARLSAVPTNRRSTIRATASAAGASIGVIQRLLAGEELTARTTTIKLVLTPENRLKRVSYALSFVDDAATVHDGVEVRAFSSIMNVVHVDEKWFNHDKKTRRNYLLPGEEAPERHCRSARHIEKIMFLAAVARLRYDPHRKTDFDEKIGLRPFAEDYIAQRTSKYRPAGNALKRNLGVVGKDVYKEFLLGYVFPAIKVKWLRGDSGKVIYVQQDNASPHVSVDDPEIVREETSCGWNIRLVCQPAYSPHFNVLDLRYFSSIQNIQYETYMTTTEMLITVAEESFRKLDQVRLDNIFLTLQQVMECVLRCQGGNVYKLPHIGKAKLRRHDSMPQFLIHKNGVFDDAVKTAPKKGSKKVW